MKNLKLALIASAFVVTGSSIAATDGILGTTSTGTSDVIIIKQDAVLITGVADLDFGTVATMAADTVMSDDVCVFSSTGGYTVTASSGFGAGAGFALDGGAAGSLNYALTWNGAPLADAAVMAGQTGDATSMACGGTPNANFAATIAAADFNAATPATYQDTVTFVIASE